MVQTINEYPARPPSIFMIQCQHRPQRARTCDALTEAIKNLGSGWWQCFDSTWLVSTAKTIGEVRDALEPHLGAGDRLMVLAYGEGAAFAGFSDLHVAWLQENPPRRQSAEMGASSTNFRRRKATRSATERRSEYLVHV